MALDPLHLLRNASIPTLVGGRARRLGRDLMYGSIPAFPSYAALVAAEAGLPARLTRPPPAHTLSSQDEFATARFAESAVCTFDPSALRGWLKPEEWVYVATLTDASLFRQRVLRRCAADEVSSQQATVQDVHLSRHHKEDLIQKGYLKRIRRAAFRCSIFAVWKPDGTLRLIWNGVPFNALCNPPPEMHILPYPLMLAILLEPGVLSYVCYDFRTWFLQITVVAEVAEYFACRFPNGEIFLVCGVPMGWSWACAIAQALTQAFARAVIAELGLPRRQVTLAFCIDNTIWAIRDASVKPAAIMAAVTRVAARFGIQLKDSATELGASVDWLPYVLNAQTHTAAFKASYREKLTTLQACAERQTGRPTALIDVWQALGLLVFSAYAARLPLSDARVKPLILWMGEHTPLQSDPTGWGRDVVFPHWLEAAAFARDLCGMTIRAPPVPTERVMAWFISDSATGSSGSVGHDVYILLLPNVTRLVVSTQEGAIAASELRTHVRATHAAFLALRDSEQLAVSRGDGIVGFGDNVVALAAQRRGYALWADDQLARQVTELREELEQAGMHLLAPYVEGGDAGACLADVWTRAGDLGVRNFRPCTTHLFRPGELCQCTVRALRAIAPSPVLWDATYERFMSKDRRPQLTADPRWSWM